MLGRILSPKPAHSPTIGGCARAGPLLYGRGAEAPRRHGGAVDRRTEARGSYFLGEALTDADRLRHQPVELSRAGGRSGNLAGSIRGDLHPARSNRRIRQSAIA